MSLTLRHLAKKFAFHSHFAHTVWKLECHKNNHFFIQLGSFLPSELKNFAVMHKIQCAVAIIYFWNETTTVRVLLRKYTYVASS